MDKVLIGIPTRDRPEYLASLLSTILFQTYKEFDVLVVDTAPLGVKNLESPLRKDPHIQRLGAALDGQGCNLAIVQVDVSGRSEATAVNHILSRAMSEGYDFVYKVDDDHVMPPDTLERMIAALEKAEELGHKNVLISGVTPWMYAPWEGAAAPDDPVRRTQEITGPLTDIYLENGKHKIEVGHFHKYDHRALVETKLASAANFLMRPDVSVLWSDVGHSSLFADAIWFLQLQKFLGYRLFFDPGLWVWHVAAPHGGVRDKEGEHDKLSEADDRRRDQLDQVLKSLEMGKPGWPNRR